MQATIFEKPQVQTMTQIALPEKKKRNRERVLTTRDIKILTWIGEMYTVRLDLLQKLLADDAGKGRREQIKQGELSYTTTLTHVQKWRDMGLAETRKMLGDEPLYIWLTSKGLREMGLTDYSYQPPSLSLIKHYHLVTLVRRYIELRQPEYTWISERKLRGEVSSIDAKERKNKHVPDGVITPPKTLIDRAIEIELTRKSKAEQEIKISRLARDYNLTYYFCTPQTEEQTRTLTTPYKDKFEIRPLQIVLDEVGINS